MNNFAEIKFESLSENERFARMAVSSFALPYNPTAEEISDIKTAVSEAVTNAVVHGYGNKRGIIEIKMYADGNVLKIEVLDDGVGISDVAKAREPFFTTCGDGTRSGMGFTVMESFTDKVEVVSAPDEGTRVVMYKKIGGKN